MALLPAIRHLASSTKSALGCIYHLCYIKSRVTKKRQGIRSVTDSRIEICVSAPPRDGEANQAIRTILSDILKLPKSDIDIVKGHKSRHKTIAIDGIGVEDNPEEVIFRLRDGLRSVRPDVR